MKRCSCCGTDRDPSVGTPIGVSAARDKCAYCCGFPRTDKGGCWGKHGAALERFLAELLASGKLGPRAVQQIMLREQSRLERPWR